MAPLAMAEVRKHSKADDLWVVLDGKVYDLTEFSKSHPGGAKVILQNAGKDGTAPYLHTHPRDLVSRLLGDNTCVGEIEASTVLPDDKSPAPVKVARSVGQSSAGYTKPPLSSMLNAFDFEAVARHEMDAEGWGYYSSGADDEVTLRENHRAFQRIWLRPRILVNVDNVDFRCTLLGQPSSLPLYITATALGKLADPAGELAIVRAANSGGVVYMLPTLSSYSLDEMLDARGHGQPVFSQLYVNRQRERTREYVQRLEQRGVKALFITVDAPQLGRREKDMRNKMTDAGTNVQNEGGDDVDRDQGVARAISSFIDPSLCWEDLAWFKSITSLPLILKGVQCSEDAVLALRHGCSGIVLSNHGGRQLDMARSGIEVLPEVMAALREDPAYRRGSFDVFVDGGIRRGADIFKAYALGASAVGIGRPCLYSLAAYGQRGVERMLSIFKDELTMCMRLSGTPTLKHITPKHVITRNLADHFAAQPQDFLADNTYEPLYTAAALRTSRM